MYQYIREDENYFIGFKTLEEKNIFTSLISVSGIGNKTVLNILC